MDMREQAEAALGSRFSPLDFHKLLLDLGPVPFSVTPPPVYGLAGGTGLTGCGPVRIIFTV